MCRTPTRVSFYPTLHVSPYPISVSFVSYSGRPGKRKSSELVWRNQSTSRRTSKTLDTHSTRYDRTDTTQREVTRCKFRCLRGYGPLQVFQ